MTADETHERRFWAKVDKNGSGGCWLWTASCFRTGYPQFRANGTMVRGHRWAYEFLVGPIPEGLHLDHLCRVRHCVNPAHLEPVTQRENNRRGNGWSGRKARQTECIHGHPLDGENLRVLPNGRRQCLACRDRRNRERFLDAA